MKKPSSLEPLRRTTFSSGLKTAEAWDYSPTPEDFRFMGKALRQAKLAIRNRDVAIGAVLVSETGRYWEAHSTSASEEDPYAHAEVNVTRKAKADGERLARMLPTSRLYLTMEPCFGDSYFLTQDGSIGTVLAAAAYEDVPNFLSHRDRGLHAHDIFENSGRSLTIVHGLLHQEALDLMVSDNKFHQSNPVA